MSAYQAVCERLPIGWRPSYVGLFPGRPGAPLRIGEYLSPKALVRCCEVPRYLRDCLECVGFRAYTEEMLQRCVELMGLAPSVDYQLDVFPDGSLGDTFGLSLSLNELKPREVGPCMTAGYGAQLFGLLEAWGLADDRWKLIGDAVFAQHFGYERADEGMGRLALCVLPNFTKVKFVHGAPGPAKLYLMCLAKELG